MNRAAYACAQHHWASWTRSPLIWQHYPCLTKTATLMGFPAIRNFATVGGQPQRLPSADTALRLPPGATAHLVGTQENVTCRWKTLFVGPARPPWLRMSVPVD
ncbi:MAG: hypothetical protein U0401_17340 [Anaerolineae bacterium]